MLSLGIGLTSVPVLARRSGYDPDAFALAANRAAGGISQLYTRRTSATIMQVGLEYQNGRGAEWQLVVNADGMLLLRGGYEGALTTYNAGVSASGLSGNFNTGSQPNTYCTVAGSVFTVAFKGSILALSHFADNRGGLWNVSIDGGAAIPVSVWQATGADKVSVVATGLPDTAHTAVFTFAGADPNNAPTGTARGWIKYRDDGTVNTCVYQDSAVARPIATSTQAMAVNSVTEFAMNVKPAGTGLTSDWVPLHTNAGACRNIARTIWVNGVSIGGDITAINLAATRVSSIKIVQTYDAYCPGDAAGSYLLWSGTLVHEITRGLGLEVSHSIKVKSAATVAAGYFASMLAAAVPAMPKLKVKNTVAVFEPTGTTASSVNVNAPAVDASYFNPAGGLALSISQQSLIDAVGTTAAGYVPGAIFYTDRTDGVSKLYWERFHGIDLSVGLEAKTAALFALVGNVDLSFLGI